MQTEQPQANHRNRQALPPGARRAHLHHHPCGQRDEHHRQAHDKRPFAERRRRGDRIDPQAEVERKPESADDEFWPVLLLRAKTAAERQQKQRGEEKRSPRNANTGMPAIASRENIQPQAAITVAAISSRSACRWRTIRASPCVLAYQPGTAPPLKIVSAAFATSGDWYDCINSFTFCASLLSSRVTMMFT